MRPPHGPIRRLGLAAAIAFGLIPHAGADEPRTTIAEAEAGATTERLRAGLTVAVRALPTLGVESGPLWARLRAALIAASPKRIPHDSLAFERVRRLLREAGGIPATPPEPAKPFSPAFAQMLKADYIYLERREIGAPWRGDAIRAKRRAFFDEWAASAAGCIFDPAWRSLDEGWIGALCPQDVAAAEIDSPATYGLGAERIIPETSGEFESRNEDLPRRLTLTYDRDAAKLRVRFVVPARDPSEATATMPRLRAPIDGAGFAAVRDILEPALRDVLAHRCVDQVDLDAALRRSSGLDAVSRDDAVARDDEIIVGEIGRCRVSTFMAPSAWADQLSVDWRADGLQERCERVRGEADQFAAFLRCEHDESERVTVAVSIGEWRGEATSKGHAGGAARIERLTRSIPPEWREDVAASDMNPNFNLSYRPSHFSCMPGCMDEGDQIAFAAHDRPPPETIFADYELAERHRDQSRYTRYKERVRSHPVGAPLRSSQIVDGRFVEFWLADNARNARFAPRGAAPNLNWTATLFDDADCSKRRSRERPIQIEGDIFGSDVSNRILLPAYFRPEIDAFQLEANGEIVSECASPKNEPTIAGTASGEVAFAFGEIMLTRSFRPMHAVILSRDKRLQQMHSTVASLVQRINGALARGADPPLFTFFVVDKNGDLREELDLRFTDDPRRALARATRRLSETTAAPSNPFEHLRQFWERTRAETIASVVYAGGDFTSNLSGGTLGYALIYTSRGTPLHVLSVEGGCPNWVADAAATTCFDTSAADYYPACDRTVSDGYMPDRCDPAASRKGLAAACYLENAVLKETRSSECR